jgi:hypothetical protein
MKARLADMEKEAAKLKEMQASRSRAGRGDAACWLAHSRPPQADGPRQMLAPNLHCDPCVSSAGQGAEGGGHGALGQRLCRHSGQGGGRRPLRWAPCCRLLRFCAGAPATPPLLRPEHDAERSPQQATCVACTAVYVGNVDYSCTPEELQMHFQSCGTVNRVTILTGGCGGGGARRACPACPARSSSAAWPGLAALSPLRRKLPP